MIRSLCFAFFLLGSCAPATPTTYYGEDQLVPIFIDIHIAKAAIQNAPPAIRDSLYAVYFQQLCVIHRVNEDSLQHDMDFLTNEPDRMDRLYVQVVDSLEVRMNDNRAAD